MFIILFGTDLRTSIVTKYSVRLNTCLIGADIAGTPAPSLMTEQLITITITFTFLLSEQLQLQLTHW